MRIADTALLYVLLALGLNIVVGYAGLLDLGFVAFFAIGAYMYGLMASPHLSETFPWFAQMFPDGLHMLDLAGRSRWARRSRASSASCWARRRSSCAATTWPS